MPRAVVIPNKPPIFPRVWGKGLHYTGFSNSISSNHEEIREYSQLSAQKKFAPVHEYISALTLTAATAKTVVKSTQDITFLISNLSILQ